MTPIKLPACERLPSTLCIRSSKDECPPLLTHTNSQALCKSTCWNDSIETLKKTCAQEYPERAMYVQGSIDSRNSAIHNAYHTSLRPSSLFEPRHPSLKVVDSKISLLHPTWRRLARTSRRCTEENVYRTLAAQRHPKHVAECLSERSPRAIDSAHQGRMSNSSPLEIDS